MKKLIKKQQKDTKKVSWKDNNKDFLEITDTIARITNLLGILENKEGEISQNIK